MTDDDEYEYTTSIDDNIAIIRAYEKDTFLDRMRPLMEEVAKELMAAGVDFSKVRRDSDG